MNIIPMGAIEYGVCFQFKKNGPVCTKNHSYINNGYAAHYFMNNRHLVAKYKKTEHANNRFVILRDDLSGSGRQINRLKIKVRIPIP